MIDWSNSQCKCELSFVCVLRLRWEIGIGIEWCVCCYPAHDGQICFVGRGVGSGYLVRRSTASSSSWCIESYLSVELG